MCLAVLVSAPAASEVNQPATLRDYAYLFDGTADRAEECVAALVESDFESARRLCPELDNGNPLSGMALGWYEIYAVVGSERLQEIALRGIEEASSAELASLDRAASSFLVAAEAGIAEAQFEYARLLGVRRPRPSDLSEYAPDPEYLRWMKKAADQDYPLAIYMLGMQAYSSIVMPGGATADNEFLPYLEKAAELGFEEAQNMLEQYRHDEALPRRAASGDAEAQREYAIDLNFQGRAGNRPELVEEALELMKAAADGGDSEALRLAGNWSWPQDPEASENYLLAAAAGQDSKAMMSLGNLYACKGDAKASRRWFVAAQQLKHPEARYAIAELDEWGLDEWDCRII